MAPCPQCVKAHKICIVKEGYSRCALCVRKNIICGGTFSDAEFDSLENQKKELRRKNETLRNELAALARRIIAAQQEQVKVESRLEKITKKQSDMVDREARLLGELADDGPDDFNFAVMSDDFLMEDPSWLDPSAMIGDTGQQVSG